MSCRTKSPAVKINDNMIIGANPAKALPVNKEVALSLTVWPVIDDMPKIKNMLNAINVAVTRYNVLFSILEYLREPSI